VKGIILAGGNGSRLWPMTASISKSLLPIYDKPMIYYPLTTLMLTGVDEILVICSPNQIDLYRNLLGNGSQWGIKFIFKIQEKPRGIAESLLLSEDFIQSDNFTLILGDNFIYGNGLGRNLVQDFSQNKATIVAFEVANPSEYGVVHFNESGEPVSIVEKPIESNSNWAIPGLYFFTSTAIEYAKSLTPSPRGELEITDVLNCYLEKGDLEVKRLPRGTAWLDMGTARSMLEAGEFVRTLQTRQGLLIGSPEETSLRMGFIQRSIDLDIPDVKNEYVQFLYNLRNEL